MNSTQAIVKRHSKLVPFEDKSAGLEALRQKNKLQKHTLEAWKMRERRRKFVVDDYAFATFMSVITAAWAFPVFLDIPFDPSVTEFIATGIFGAFAGPLGIAAYVFGPQAVNLLAVPDDASSIQQLTWPMRARLRAMATLANRKEGWQPREGLPHPKGRDDTHDRFKVRVFTNENEQLTVVMERWQYRTQPLEKVTLAGRTKTARRTKYNCWQGNLLEFETLKSFENEEDAFDYYQTLMLAVPERENRAIKALEDQRFSQQQSVLEQAKQQQLRQSQAQLSQKEQDHEMEQRKIKAQQLVDIARVLDRKM